MAYIESGKKGPSSSSDGAYDHHSYLLLLRCIVLNVGIGFGFAALYGHGWIDLVLLEDKFYLVRAIGGVFMIGFLFCVYKIFQTSREINYVKVFEFSPKDRSIPRRALVREYFRDIEGVSTNSRTLIASTFWKKVSSRIVIFKYIAAALVTLGLIGTVIGFIIALSGVDPEIATDVRAVVPMVSELVLGLSVALYTTLAGATLYLWLIFNYFILAHGTTVLVTRIVKTGERNSGF